MVHEFISMIAESWLVLLMFGHRYHINEMLENLMLNQPLDPELPSLLKVFFKPIVELLDVWSNLYAGFQTLGTFGVNGTVKKRIVVECNKLGDKSLKLIDVTILFLIQNFVQVGILNLVNDS